VFVTFADGLMYLFELADKEDSRFQPAAARWHARYVLAAELPLSESEMVMNMLCGILGASRHVLRRRLLEGVQRAGLSTTDIR
jgi:hypothetical protein